MSSSPSLRTRALLAVVLTVTFYTLAIGLAVALIAAPIVLYAATESGNIWVAIGLAGAGLAILRAIIPPRNRFEPPGPELTREQHPELHAELDDVAAQAKAEPADNVYLDLALNAAVLQHRRRRIMILGLPLLATLGRDELRAVIAHEYGHFTAGDTRFGSWIWRTRTAVLRTVAELANSESWFRRYVVRWPFDGYARLFLRITNAVSRRAEFGADSLAARVASPEAAGRALRRLDALDPAYASFWQSDVATLLEAERRPPIAQGFSTFATHQELAAQLDEVLAADLEATDPDPYASHPTLRQRLEALGQPADASLPPAPEHPALELVNDIDLLERDLLASRFGVELEGFRPIAWDEATAIHQQRLAELAGRFAAAVPPDMTLADAGDAAGDLARFRPALRELLDADDTSTNEETDRLAFEVLAAHVFQAGARAGAVASANPGEPLRLTLAGETLDPWAVLAAIAVEEREASTWATEPVVAALASTPLRTTADEGLHTATG